MAHDKDNEKTENENAETENAETEANAEVEAAETASKDEGETLLDAEPAAVSDKASASGADYVDADLDVALLEEELVEENRPTSSQNALEIKILWGGTVLDSALIHEPRDVIVSGLGNNKAGVDLSVDLPIEGLEAAQYAIASNSGDRKSVV